MRRYFVPVPVALLTATALSGCGAGSPPPRSASHGAPKPYQSTADGMVIGPSAQPDASPREPVSQFKAVMLDAHNKERARVGSKPLVWNATLAIDARKWAEQLDKTGKFEHAPQSADYAKAQGENLWKGTRGAYSFRAMVEGWIGEKAQYMAGVFPDVSRSGKVHDVTHYTQIIWAASRELGCAMAGTGDYDILVCRYTPVGNVVGMPIQH